MNTFPELGLIEPICRALAGEAYERPTPIQIQAIPPILTGRDVLGCAQTGTGKTAAFALPILQRLVSHPRPAPTKGARVLVLTPTRELALQVAESFGTYGRHTRLSCAAIFGGVGYQPQVTSLARGLDVLVATPGRLLDLLGQAHVRLGGVEILVLDEADRMLDMGFIRDVRKILGAIPKQRQTLLFSATMPESVRDLAESVMQDPVSVAATPVGSTVEQIEQYVLFVERENKRALLGEVLRNPAMKRTIVFTRTKHLANRLAEQLCRSEVQAQAIHGNKSQGARQRALEDFRAGRSRVLVATDIAARGIDVDGITHVVNYELPMDPEGYVHRIGRTARAGATGVALSFCDREERSRLRDIERLTRRPMRVIIDHPYASQGGRGVSREAR